MKPSLTSSEMALLRSLPPPPPPPSPPPLSSSSPDDDDKTLQLFYAQLNGDQFQVTSSIHDTETTVSSVKYEQQQPQPQPQPQPHHHHHHHKDKKPVRKEI